MEPKLLPLGRKRALPLTGLVWATWHMPLIYLTALLPIGKPSDRCAAVLCGRRSRKLLLRLPEAGLRRPVAFVDHATHNTAWGMMVGFTATSSPLLVNGYLLGDFGIVITVAAAIGAALVSRLVPPDRFGE